MKRPLRSQLPTSIPCRTAVLPGIIDRVSYGSSPLAISGQEKERVLTKLAVARLGRSRKIRYGWKATLGGGLSLRYRSVILLDRR